MISPSAMILAWVSSYDEFLKILFFFSCSHERRWIQNHFGTRLYRTSLQVRRRKKIILIEITFLTEINTVIPF